MLENLEKLFEIKRDNKEKYTLYFDKVEKKFYVLEENLEIEDKSFYQFDPRNEFLVKLILEEEFGGNKEKLLEFFEMFDEKVARVIEGVLKWV